jgi:hypothetical protein
MVNKKYCCRVCGLFQGEDHPPWGSDGKCPSFDICECCGVEFGYGDCFLDDVKRARKEWLDKGAFWNDPKYRPKNWSLEEQLNNIPEKFK